MMMFKGERPYADVAAGGFVCGKLTRYSKNNGGWPDMAEPPKYKFVDNLRPPCSRCGRPLVLTRIEPEEPGFDLRTYYCAHCKDSESIIAAVGKA